jgi:hypothetical protein
MHGPVGPGGPAGPVGPGVLIKTKEPLLCFTHIFASAVLTANSPVRKLLAVGTDPLVVLYGILILIAIF